MYLQNSLHSNIDLYLNKLNKRLKENYELKADYKTYDKQEYNDNIKNIDNLILDFKTFSANWGNIINIPYLSINDSSMHNGDSFKYFIVKPGKKLIYINYVVTIIIQIFLNVIPRQIDL